MDFRTTEQKLAAILRTSPHAGGKTGQASSALGRTGGAEGCRLGRARKS